MDTTMNALANLRTALTGDLLWVIAVIAVFCVVACIYDTPTTSKENR